MVSMDDQFLANIYQIIEENFSDETFSVVNLAQKAGISRSALHRKLIKLTGRSATDIIMEIRLNHAKEMLENHVATVSEIAYKVGFNNTSYFHRSFKKRFQLSPGNYKKNHDDENLQQFAMQHPSIAAIKKLKPFYKKQIAISVFTVIVIAVFGVYWLSWKQNSDEKSIAVLPIQNLTGDPGNDYFAHSIHITLVNELGKINSLRVISWRSSKSYQNSDLTLKDIATEVGVNHIVEGSLYCIGDSICFSTQLIDPFPEEHHLLSNEYNDDMTNVLFVQSNAIKDIVRKIKVRLSRKEKRRLAKPRTIEPELYKAYLRGMYYVNQGTIEQFEKGIQYLEEAIDIDPGNSFGYAALALGYAARAHAQFNTEESFLRTMSAIEKAITLDPESDEAHTALAMIYLYHDNNWLKAKEEFDIVLANNPNNALAHYHYAWYYVLFGDKEKAIDHISKAVMLEPRWAGLLSMLSLQYWYFDEFDKAEYWAKKALEINEDTPYGNITLSWIYLHRKEYEKALEYIEKVKYDIQYIKMLYGYVYVNTGHRQTALEYWKEFEEAYKEGTMHPAFMGMTAAYLGFTDRAFELLNKAWDENRYPITFINFYPMTKDIRNDPRFAELMKKMNLPFNDELKIVSQQ